MSVFGLTLLPAFLIFIGMIVSRVAQLRLLSRSSRHLDQIDIPNEVKEVRINEVEMLASVEADFHFLYAWKLTRWQRRQATGRRVREARKWLHLIISNATLFQEIARFHIERAASPQAASSEKEDELASQVLGRASTVQVIAAVCLAKLAVIDVCRVIFPLYVPELAGHFQFRGQDLTAWYRHLLKDMLQLAKTYYDDITYTRFIFQLTGLFDVEAAEGLSRL